MACLSVLGAPWILDSTLGNTVSLNGPLNDVMEWKHDGKRVKNGREREKVLEGRMINMVEKAIERE
jgi:hypothetical protein